MHSIILDILPFTEKAEVHRYFQECMEFEEYYGCNLDALYEELTSMIEPVAVTLRYAAHPRGKMADYLPRLLSVFHDAARENYNLTVSFQEVA